MMRSRLQALLSRAAFTPKKRTATKPTRSSIKKRIESKTQRGQLKAMRGKVDE